MNEILIFIQKEAFKLCKKKYSKKYIKLRIQPIISYINSSNNKKFLISGSQGIGKSSLILIIKKTLERFYNKKILTLSLDDYYFTKFKRQQLAKEEHELLATRGVPGTHDIKTLLKDIKKFENNKYPLNIPIFDKLIDTRLKKKNKIYKKCDLLILEGWCCGCKRINNNYLYKNNNLIEKKFDKDFIWRNYYNKRLGNEYKKLFNLFEDKIFLKAPSFKYVLNWRIKQEKRNTTASIKYKKMNTDEIKLFIQHYEKITKWMLREFNRFANLVIRIDKDQKIISVKKI